MSFKSTKKEGTIVPSLKFINRVFYAVFFFEKKYNPMNATIKIAGNNSMFDKVICPAAKSAASPTRPCASATTFLSLIHPPITGWNMEEENIPIPPMMDKPNAPVSGSLDPTKPSMFGQK